MVQNLIKQRLVPFGIEDSRESHGVANRHPAVDRVPFGQVGDPTTRVGRKLGCVVAQHRCRTACGVDHAEQHLDRGRLAGAVAAQEAVDRSPWDPQVEAVDDALRSVVLGQPLRFDHMVHADTLVSLPCADHQGQSAAWAAAARGSPIPPPHASVCQWKLPARSAASARTSWEENPKWTASVRKPIEQLQELLFTDFLRQLGLRFGDEYAETGPGVNRTIALQFGVDSRDRIRVDHQRPRQFTDGRQTLLRRHRATHHRLAELVAKLPVDRLSAGRVDAKFHGPLADSTWFGIAPVAAGVFGVPAGTLALVLVSLFTPAPPAEAADRFVDHLRRPGT